MFIVRQGNNTGRNWNNHIETLPICDLYVNCLNKSIVLSTETAIEKDLISIEAVLLSVLGMISQLR